MRRAALPASMARIISLHHRRDRAERGAASTGNPVSAAPGFRVEIAFVMAVTATCSTRKGESHSACVGGGICLPAINGCGKIALATADTGMRREGIIDLASAYTGPVGAYPVILAAADTAPISEIGIILASANARTRALGVIVRSAANAGKSAAGTIIVAAADTGEAIGSNILKSRSDHRIRRGDGVLESEHHPAILGIGIMVPRDNIVGAGLVIDGPGSVIGCAGAGAEKTPDRADGNGLYLPLIIVAHDQVAQAVGGIGETLTVNDLQVGAVDKDFWQILGRTVAIDVHQIHIHVDIGREIGQEPGQGKYRIALQRRDIALQLANAGLQVTDVRIGVCELYLL